LTVTPDEDLTNGDDFYAYVKVETGGLWSDWDQGPAFDIELTQPTSPTVVATIDNTTASVSVHLESPLIDGYENYRFVVRRYVEDIDTGYVRGASPTDPLPDDETDPDVPQATITDREAPLGRTLRYEAQALADFVEA